MQWWQQNIERQANQTIQSWFDHIAGYLLNQTSLFIMEQPHRIEEIEFYYRTPKHDDPFTHGDSHQRQNATWYFHREGGNYRGGSFKGLDITFGPEDAYGGILIRTISSDEQQINGCSLCVDHLLKTTKLDHVSKLDAHLKPLHVFDQNPYLYLAPHHNSTRTITQTARVGLTLKRCAQNPTMPDFITRPYRYLTDPTIKKGKIYTIMALHQQGDDVAAIHAKTRSPKKSINTYITHYNHGLTLDSTESLHGKALKSADLACLHGICAS